MTFRSITKQRGKLVVLIVAQSLAATFFVFDMVRDVIREMGTGGFDPHLLVETSAAGFLILGIVVEVLFLRALLERQAHSERGLSIAAGALNEVMEAYFRSWNLTPSEEAVAAFTLKGFSISEIAELRQSREGTIKAHLNAIYRKAGVNGRGSLVSLLIEDLMSQPLVRPEFATSSTG